MTSGTAPWYDGSQRGLSRCHEELLSCPVTEYGRGARNYCFGAILLTSCGAES
jgi:hypothetical protein